MSRFGDVVVVIPGLIGSKLVKDGKALWGTSPGALWSVVAGNGLKALTMSGPDHLEEDLGDGIKAAGLIDNPEIIPGLWKQGGYSRLRESLVKSHLLQEGKNYFEFSYDWRRDNRVNARKLMHLA